MTINLKEFFSIFIIVMPIIGIYATPIPGLNMAELILIIFWGIVILKKRKFNTLNNKNKKLFGLVIYFTISFIIASLCFNFKLEGLLSFIRFNFYYVSAVILGQSFFDFKIFSKYIIKISYLIIIFIIIQYIYYYKTHRALSGFLPFFDIYLQEYATLDFTLEAKTFFFRPTSFFLEPAHFSQFMFVPFIISLWTKKDIFIKILIWIGFFLSTSSQGILISFIIVAYYLKKEYFEKKFDYKKLVITIFFLILGMFIMFAISKTKIFSYSMGRILSGGKESAAYARLGGYEIILSEINIVSFFIGYGFGNTPKNLWLSGLAYVFYGSGILGVFLLFDYLKSCWNNNMVKCMILVFIITLIEASIFMNLIIIIYICFISNKIEERVKE